MILTVFVCVFMFVFLPGFECVCVFVCACGCV